MTFASPDLLRVLIRQNLDASQGLRRMPPADVDSPSGRAHFMHVDALREQTIKLYERLDWYAKNPLPQPRRRTWRDIPPAGSWK